MALRDLKRGEKSYSAFRGAPMLYAVISAMAVDKGYAREVKHRDHTRSHVLVDAGARALGGAHG